MISANRLFNLFKLILRIHQQIPYLLAPLILSIIKLHDVFKFSLSFSRKLLHFMNLFFILIFVHSYEMSNLVLHQTLCKNPSVNLMLFSTAHIPGSGTLRIYVVIYFTKLRAFVTGASGEVFH